MSTPLDPEALARLSLHDSTHFEIQLSQTKHRLDILQQWDIPSGSKVLELGCGQGDTTTVLAAAVGEAGIVVAVDPADLEYGEFTHRLSMRFSLRSIQPPVRPLYRLALYPRSSTRSYPSRCTRLADSMDSTTTSRLS